MGYNGVRNYIYDTFNIFDGTNVTIDGEVINGETYLYLKNGLNFYKLGNFSSTTLSNTEYKEGNKLNRIEDSGNVILIDKRLSIIEKYIKDKLLFFSELYDFDSSIEVFTEMVRYVHIDVKTRLVESHEYPYQDIDFLYVDRLNIECVISLNDKGYSFSDSNIPCCFKLKYNEID